MTLLRLAAGTALVSAVTTLASLAPAHAVAMDYRFEVVEAHPAGKNMSDVTVRLMHVPDGKAVTGAIIFQTRVDMGPEGMGEMTGKVSPQAAGSAGLYQFRTETGMEGKWALTLTAKVSGEAATIRGTVTFDAK